jgi:hypothetical protein
MMILVTVSLLVDQNSMYLKLCQLPGYCQLPGDNAYHGHRLTGDIAAVEFS